MVSTFTPGKLHIASRTLAKTSTSNGASEDNIRGASKKQKKGRVLSAKEQQPQRLNKCNEMDEL
jgi:hypothetical protein